MKPLILPLKRRWFDEIRQGIKAEELRVYNDYWRKRLEGREYSHIELTLGYPPRHDTSRRIFKPWLGYEIKTVTHPHFGPEPIKVYAIKILQE